MARGLPPPPDEPSGIAGELPEAEGFDYPVLRAAANDLLRRKVLTPAAYQDLTEEAKAQAFSVVGVAEEDVLTRIQQVLSEDILRGGTLRQFRRRLADELEVSALGRGQVENLYRTALGVSHANGQDQAGQQPAVRDHFPYRMEAVILDSRTTELCLAIHRGGLDGTPVFRADDPVFREYRSPRHWQCRCTTVFLTKEDAARRGVREAIEWVRTGMPPEQPEWVARPGVELPKGWTR